MKRAEDASIEQSTENESERRAEEEQRKSNTAGTSKIHCSIYSSLYISGSSRTRHPFQTTKTPLQEFGRGTACRSEIGEDAMKGSPECAILEEEGE